MSKTIEPETSPYAGMTEDEADACFLAELDENAAEFSVFLEVLGDENADDVPADWRQKYVSIRVVDGLSHSETVALFNSWISETQS